MRQVNGRLAKIHVPVSSHRLDNKLLNEKQNLFVGRE